MYDTVVYQEGHTCCLLLVVKEEVALQILEVTADNGDWVEDDRSSPCIYTGIYICSWSYRSVLTKLKDSFGTDTGSTVKVQIFGVECCCEVDCGIT